MLHTRKLTEDKYRAALEYTSIQVEIGTFNQRVTEEADQLNKRLSDARSALGIPEDAKNFKLDMTSSQYTYESDRPRRGRPSKAAAENGSEAPAPKRKRGRPRKQKAEAAK